MDLFLPPDLRRATLQAAKAADMSPGDLIRSALAADLKRRAYPAKTPNRADEQLLGPLRVLLAQDFAAAQDWGDLIARLRAKGYALHEAGGGLALHSHPEGLRLCKASELGHSYGALLRRYGAPFPGHSHHHLVTRLLETTTPPPQARDDGDDDDFQVIEDD
ncbi:hypothetical protein FIU97_00610 [Roseivivax sp. THAF40]|uniref:hypothetical protein n=1 Tax=unclassified Roseivivax TaxID=2639302 RepID=UPI0012A7F8FB|nr:MULTISPECIES: hypothetical protein [unclassified Roseivivax]QFS81332.1 hypothetical protein FIV09_00695 [Roseivivax sp. THAF197b]QFT45061.1 hypothetical protein FIU97_00610 [Roseivivax sp. THAF40]